MVHSKEISLKTLIRSNKGIHLTAYLQNTGNIIELESQLRNVIDDAKETLDEVLSKEKQIQFLLPLEQILKDPSMLKKMRKNIGIFRTQDAFRMLSLPVEVENITVVASSFHVKPLLKWIQTDYEFLLLGIEKDSASLYWGSGDQVKLIDTLLFPETLKSGIQETSYLDFKKTRQQKMKSEETLEWLNEWLYEVTRKGSLPLFLAGENSLLKPISKGVRYPKLRKKPINLSFSRELPGESIAAARTLLVRETKNTLNKAIREFRWAEDSEIGKKNIFQIAKAAVQGQVRKLIISDGIQIFGKLDKITGGISIHPFHLDHEDDDLLDDLAQTVIEKGGQVVIASQDQIPKGRPLLAILKKPPRETTQHYLEYENSNNKAYA